MNKKEEADSRIFSQAAAWKFILLVGVVSLFSDMTYEAARSITGPYLGLLGASATVVGIVAGLGEFIGYALRLASGYLTDRLGRYWGITITGYALNLFAVPLLALAGHWPLAATLMIVERLGKAVRTPARDAMLSHAATEVGRGWGFGFHEAMDQTGAMLGPLIVALVLYLQGGYRAAFAFLLLPAVLAIVVITMAARAYPQPQYLEVTAPALETRGLTPPYWLYVAAVGLIAAGFADFPLIAFHFSKTAVVSPQWIPLFYAIAMGVDAVAALILGRLFDRLGMPVIMTVAVIAALFGPLVFFGGFGVALAGMVLWGIGMGAQESVIKAALAELVPRDRRATGFGVFHTAFGLLWFLGSAIMGLLYDVSLIGLAAFSVFAQLLALPLLLAVSRRVCLVP
ncbi:MAG: MFS transporter [Desulfobaccales bacterium]